MCGRPLDEAKYDASRWIIEPSIACSTAAENDGAGADAGGAGRARERPAAQAGVPDGRGAGRHHRSAAPVHNAPDYASAHFKTVAKNLWAMAKMGPSDIDVVQAYENFTGGVLLAGGARLRRAEVGQRIPRCWRTLRPAPEDAAQHQRRQPGGVLHARPRDGQRRRAAAARHRPQPVAGANTVAVLGGPMVTPVSSRSRHGGRTVNATTHALPAGLPAGPRRRTADPPLLGRHARRQARHPALPELRQAPVGAEWLATAATPSTSTGSRWRRAAASGAGSARTTRYIPPQGRDAVTIVLVELPHADNVRMVGNLLIAPDAPVVIGAEMEAVFEPHDAARDAHTLVQWRLKA